MKHALTNSASSGGRKSKLPRLPDFMLLVFVVLAYFVLYNAKPGLIGSFLSRVIDKHS